MTQTQSLPPSPAARRGTELPRIMGTHRPSEPVVRALTGSDWPGYSTVMGRAFEDDPVMNFVISAPPPVAPRAGRLLTALAESHGPEAIALGAFAESGTLHGAACWTTPDHWRLPTSAYLRFAPRLISTVGIRSMLRVSVLAAIEKRHPSEPHYYLAAIGTEPKHQGTGVGSALMRPMIERCDEEGIGAYLESSKKTNLAFYHSFGFELREELVLKGGPTMYLMWRDPR